MPARRHPVGAVGLENQRRAGDAVARTQCGAVAHRGIGMTAVEEDRGDGMCHHARSLRCPLARQILYGIGQTNRLDCRCLDDERAVGRGETVTLPMRRLEPLADRRGRTGLDD